MSQVSILLKAFDENWSHQWESFRPLLSDVAEHEAWWQHESYVGEKDPKGLSQPGTIRWHIGHLEQCARRHIQILRMRPVTEQHFADTTGINTRRLLQLRLILALT